MPEKAFGILDVFTKEQLSSFKQDLNGNLHGPCPSCGRKDNYSGFTIFVDSNTCYCSGSKTIFNLLETIALVKGIITCREGRQKI